MRIIVLQLILSIVCFNAQIVSIKAQNRPNILIIIADDMGTDAFSPYNIGTDLPSTPILNQLASQGILFENAWSYPTCAPSRASLMTGRYGNKNGVSRSGPNMPNSETTLFEHIDALSSGEYANAVFGKWHLGNANHPNNNGVQHYDGNLFSNPDDYYEWERTINGVTDTSTTYVTTYLTDEAINWIDNQTQPWLLWMAYNAPHSPYHLPPDSLYTRTQTSSNFDKYMCMIESVDHETGRLYNSLTQEEKDNTIILFVGDNGTPNGRLQGYPSGHGKNSLYEGGIRVPMFISGYGVERINETEDALVSFSDVFATLTELLGEDLPGGIDNSFSFFSLLSDSDAATRPYNYSEIETATDIVDRTIRNDRYKLITKSDGSQEFYDLSIDPFELDDLKMSGLSAEQNVILAELQNESDSVFYSWSCNDGIQNGNEAGVDCGGSSCMPCITTHVENAFTKDALLFPNPIKEALNIALNDGSYSVRILDLTGRLIVHDAFEGQYLLMDVGMLVPGIYFLEIVDLKYRQSLVKKMIKE